MITDNFHFCNDLSIPDIDFKGNSLFIISNKVLPLSQCRSLRKSGLSNCIFNVYNVLSQPAAVEDIWRDIKTLAPSARAGRGYIEGLIEDI